MNAYVCFCLVFTSDAHALKQNHQNYILFNILIKQSLSNKAVNCTYNKSIICTILQNSGINRRIGKKVDLLPHMYNFIMHIMAERM